MRLWPHRILVVFFVVVAMSSTAMAAASGVIRLELPDAAAVGKGSAFVGQANRASAVYYNPAGIVQLGTEMSFGITALQPQIEYKPDSGDAVQARRNVFVFPHIYFATPVVKDKFYVGFGENSNYGSGNEWAADSPTTFTRYSMIHNEYENKDFMFVGAYKANEQWSFALALDNDSSKIEKQKKIYQSGANDDADSQLKAKDSAWGYRLATLYKLNEQHQFGLMYRSRINHEYEGKLKFTGLNTNSSLFGPGVGYQGVFGGTSFETSSVQKFTLPQSVALGYSFKPTSKWTFNFDVEWLDWSSSEQHPTEFPDVTNATQKAVLYTHNPSPRDWKSVWSQSLGLEYAATDRLRLRGGYAHHQTPIGQDTWDTSYPDANSHSFTTGLGYDLTKNFSLDLAYVAVLYQPRKIQNEVDNGFGIPGNGVNFDGRYKQFVNIGTVTVTYKF